MIYGETYNSQNASQDIYLDLHGTSLVKIIQNMGSVNSATHCNVGHIPPGHPTQFQKPGLQSGYLRKSIDQT